MFTSTVEVLPEGMIIKELFSMVENTYMVDLSKKGILQKALSYEVESAAVALETFIESVDKKANAIIGIRTSTTTASFKNGTFLYITYSGTPALIEES